MISILLNFWRVWNLGSILFSADLCLPIRRLLSYVDFHLDVSILIFIQFITSQDKGGDPATFRETRAAFEVLRSLYQEGTVKDGTFTSYLDGVVEDDIGE